MDQITEKEQKTDTAEIDLLRLCRALLKKVWLLVLVACIGFVGGFAMTKAFITPTYQSSAMFYVNNRADANGSQSNISSSDITSSKNLVNSYIVIMKAKATMEEVISHANLNLSVEQLSGMIHASAVDNTEILRVTVTSTDPYEAAMIANAIAEVFPARIATVIEGSSCKVVDYAAVPVSPSAPNTMKNAVLGAMLLFVLCTAIIVLVEILDVTIKNNGDIAQCSSLPILAEVPNMSSKEKSKKQKGNRDDAHAYLGDDVSFAASEAYKLLRTKIQFSFAGENECRVIGVSSALPSEGKSLSTINLAHSLAQLEKKVLLIDCDMRCPTLAEKVGCQKTPGLADYLTGQAPMDALCQKSNLSQNGISFGIISAGSTPPNPIELLSSARMVKLLEELRKQFDYILLDFPPVGEVSDAVATAKLTDGMLLVVRQNYCSRPVLTDTVRQFRFVEAHLLGILVNCAEDETTAYGKYGKYSKYGKYGRNSAYRSYDHKGKSAQAK